MNDGLTSQWVSIDGLKIHFVHGGAGTPVVFIHGGGNDRHEWSANLDHLARSCEVFALDFPGFGLSEAPKDPVHPHWLINFIKEFIDALGLSEITIVGQSLGGMISVAFTLDYPGRVKKLVLVDSAGLGRVSFTGQLFFHFFKTLDRLGRKQRGPRYLPGTVPEFPVAGRLNELAVPVLIIWGSADHYFPLSNARAAGKLIPDCKLEVFKGCRHAPQREDPEMFNALVSDFISKG